MNRLDILTELSGLDPDFLAEAAEYKPEVLPFLYFLFIVPDKYYL